MEKERRFCHFSENDMIKVERKESDSMIIGHAAVFNQLSQNLGHFREIIRPGFFRKALESPDRILGLFNHDDNFVLGERNAGTLELEETNYGLKYIISIANTRSVSDFVLSPIERKEITGSSFGFSISEDGYRWEESDDYEEMIHILLANGCFRLYDVGPVTFPAYTQTDTKISDRSLKKYMENQRAMKSNARQREIQNNIINKIKGLGE